VKRDVTITFTFKRRKGGEVCVSDKWNTGHTKGLRQQIVGENIFFFVYGREVAEHVTRASVNKDGVGILPI